MEFSLEAFFESQFPIIDSGKAKGFARRLEARAKANPDANDSPRVKSNTVVFAISFKGGVVVAGDRRTSGGWYDIFSDKTIKVEKLGKFSAMACAGYCNVINSLKTNMQAICETFRTRYNLELSPDGQANYLSCLLEQWWIFFVYTWAWTVAEPILATYDKELKKPRIFQFDESGYFAEFDSFAGTGCGYDVIRGLLKDRYRKDLNKKDAIDLAVRALLHSGMLSHGVSDARVAPPSIATISRSGFKWVPSEQITAIISDILKETGVKNV